MVRSNKRNSSNSGSKNNVVGIRIAVIRLTTLIVIIEKHTKNQKNDNSYSNRSTSKIVSW